jgi:WD40 repeat protein
MILHTGSNQPGTLKYPTTSLRWRNGELLSKNRYILITANADGTITHWNTRAGQVLSQFQDEEHNEVFAMDLDKPEAHLATCGKDCKVFS